MARIRLAVGHKIHSARSLLLGEAKAADINQLPRMNVYSHTRPGFDEVRGRGAKAAVSVKYQRGVHGLSLRQLLATRQSPG